MATRGLYVFKHDSKLGNAQAFSLFERIKAELKDKNSVPRSFGDYAVTVDADNLPNGVELLTLVG
jgi:CRISPR-associated protein Csd2